MRYFTIPTQTFASALARRGNTTMHFLKITKRIAIIWDRDAK